MNSEATVFQSHEQRSLDGSLRSLGQRWLEYRQRGSFERFVEFTLALDNLTEQLNRLRLPGLLRQCEGLENMALALFGDESTHPVNPQDAAALDRQIETIVNAIEGVLAPAVQGQELRRHPSLVATGAEWAKPRAIWLIAEENHPWVAGLIARGQTTIDAPTCASISYPGFFHELGGVRT